MSFDLVCRTCLKINSPETCKNIEEDENHSDILEMLSYSIPEMNMCLVIHPVLCDKCVELLRILYKFKSQCLKIEENILRFAQTAGQSKVNLSEYCKRKITCIEPKKNSRDSEMAIIDQLNQKRKITVNKKELQSINNDNKYSRKGCDGCKTNSKDPSYHLKTNYSPFTCYHCNKKIENLIGLRRHILSHVKQRKCKICGKRFRDLTVLRRHLWSHTGVKQFACNLCSKRFQQKHCLDQHMFKHQGSDKIKCSYCQKLFSTKYNAKVHMRTMHKKAESCDLCGESFMSKQQLVKHLETNSISCGTVIKTEQHQNDESDNIGHQYIKAESESMSFEDNLIGKLPDDFTEYKSRIKSEPLINDSDHYKFPYKQEVLNIRGITLLPQQ